MISAASTQKMWKCLAAESLLHFDIYNPEKKILQCHFFPLSCNPNLQLKNPPYLTHTSVQLLFKTGHFSSGLFKLPPLCSDWPVLDIHAQWVTIIGINTVRLYPVTLIHPLTQRFSIEWTPLKVRRLNTAPCCFKGDTHHQGKMLRHPKLWFLPWQPLFLPPSSVDANPRPSMLCYPGATPPYIMRLNPSNQDGNGCKSVQSGVVMKTEWIVREPKTSIKKIWTQ